MNFQDSFGEVLKLWGCVNFQNLRWVSGGNWLRKVVPCVLWGICNKEKKMERLYIMEMRFWIQNVRREKIGGSGGLVLLLPTRHVMFSQKS